MSLSLQIQFSLPFSNPNPPFISTKKLQLYPMAESIAMEVQNRELIDFRLPPLSENDPLLSQKQQMLNDRNLTVEYQIPTFSNAVEICCVLEQIVKSARILFLDERELYFVEDDDFGPFSPRNELESLNCTLLSMNNLISNATPNEIEALQKLQSATIDMINAVGAEYSDKMSTINSNVDANQLVEWAESHGVKSKLKITYFEEAGRGAVASEDIQIGDTALEIPESLIISEDLLYESDLFDVLKNLEDISSETMLLLWSMKERNNPNSKFKLYFNTLPDNFNTGLSFGIDALTTLEGTLLMEEILQAREHLHQQYDELCPILCTNHPEIFPPEFYTWERYIWACELWYSNGMKIKFSDGKLRTCLVPIAGLLNHSLCPHILRYGKVNTETNSLKFIVSRTCKKGEQCYLSYGSLPGSHLITFYGFLPKGENPYDVLPLDFDDGNNESDGTHLVRGTWFSRTGKPRTYGLPPPLLAHLRAIMSGGDVKNNDANSSQTVQNDRAVLETLISIFSPMILELNETDEADREDASWDVKLALDYKDIVRRIISSVLCSCKAGLNELDCL